MNHIVSEVTERKYWDIGDLSKMLNVQDSKIRFWCNYFGLKIKRGAANKRKFTHEDVEVIKTIKFYVDEGYHLKAIFKKLNPQ